MSKPHQLATVKSPSYMNLYANSCNLEVSPWDFKFTFGEVARSVPPEPPAAINEHVTVTMSPQHAKALLAILQQNIITYEHQVGEIKLPSEIPTMVN